MRVVLQRVNEASVSVNGLQTGVIGPGLLIFVGIEDLDDEEDVNWLAQKVLNLRIFNDEAGVMNNSVLQTGGEILLVSQFTLHASTRKGNRPSWARAGRAEIAIPLYEKMLAVLQALSGKTIQAGIFGADMQVRLVNDGPVTIMIDSKNRE